MHTGKIYHKKRVDNYTEFGAFFTTWLFGSKATTYNLTYDLSKPYLTNSNCMK